MNIGQKIRTSREALNMTQEELGKRCGTTKQTIFKYENGIVTNIPLDRLEIIADVLGVSPAYLMGWETKNAPAPEGGRGAAITVRAETLLEYFVQLNEQGQTKVIDYARDLAEGGKYSKNSANQAV